MIDGYIVQRTEGRVGVTNNIVKNGWDEVFKG